MKKRNLIFVIVLILLSFSIDGFSQVRKKSSKSKAAKEKTEKAEKVSFMDKLNPEIKFGNIGFFNGFSVSSKMNVGYKLSNRFTVGAGGKLFYDSQVIVGAPDPSNFDYGGLLYARGKITPEIYIGAEYAFMKYDYYQSKVNYPLIGAGYMSGVGDWKFGIELLYIASEQARDFQGSVVEYWFGASYRM